MKKFLTCAVLLIGSLSWADADDYILYWQITENEYKDSVAASVFAKNGNTTTRLASSDGGLGVEQLSVKGGTTELITSAISGNPATYSFFVELYSDSKTVWTSSVFAYQALADYISAPNGETGGYTVPDKGGWSISATKKDDENVPEPTSGFLLLMGLAGLALRRRKQVC